MKKKVLLIVVTHGDEQIGLEIVQKLESIKDKFDVLIANPEALKERKRFIDTDLNRSYPGEANSKNYEERIAFRNFEKVKKYEFIIDIHEASSGTDDFVIIPRENVGKKFPIELISLKKVLLWPFPKGPISQFLENAIELEFGMKNRLRGEVIAKATQVVRRFIEKPEQGIKGKDNKEYFYVYGKESSKNIGNINLFADFKETAIGKETFLPLLVGQYLKEGIAFYKMKKIKK